MRVLHFYPAGDSIISQHVEMLCRETGLTAECHAATEADQALTLLDGSRYDVLHLHGCWRNASAGVVRRALGRGVRLVVTPHGGLTPWTMAEDRWKEKLPKRLLYQRNIIGKAYAIIVHGRLEQEFMEQLGWNPRLVTVRNAVITSSITPSDMARQTWEVYRRVMDSDPLALMDDETRQVLKNLLTAGITRDRRWVAATDADGNAAQPATAVSTDAWRLLLLYGQQEDISDTMQRGIRTLGLNAPDLNTEGAPCFLPSDYEPGKSLGELLGNQYASENNRLTATFRIIRKLAAADRLCIKHLVELDDELRHHDCEEQRLEDELKDGKLWKLARRTMQLMSDLTGLTEGFMPVAPLNDRRTRQMKRRIEHRLSITG